MQRPAFGANKIGILIAEDHEVVRSALALLINAQSDMTVVSQAKDGFEAVENATAIHPDVILMDLDLPGQGGLTATQHIKTLDPSARIVALTGFSDCALVKTFLAAGGIGYVSKSSPSSELFAAVRAAWHGRAFVDSQLGGELIVQTVGTGSGLHRKSGIAVLSERERQVLELIARGNTNQCVAGVIGVSVKTVETYRARLSEKLGLNSRVDIVRYAVQSGLLGAKF